MPERALLAALLAASAAFAGYEIPGHGTLDLELPETWKQTRQPRGEAPGLDVVFLPARGDAFEVHLSVLWDPKHPEGFTTAWVQQSVESSVATIEGKVAETRIPVQALEGAEASGFYFSVTDKNPAPAPGEFTFMTQGVVSFGGAVGLSFVVLTREADSPVVGQVMEAVRGARLAGSED